MTVALYHYVHCPFCLRVRMALGYLKLPYESRVLAYDDEKTPIQLTGKKMLPILAHDKGAMNESLDIIAFLDKEDRLLTRQTLARADQDEFEELLGKIGNPVHSLAMPYWIWTPEFNTESRDYFQKKKEEKRGPFKELVRNQDRFKNELSEIFPLILPKLKPFYDQSELGIRDIMLASHLWGLYVVPEFQFPPQLHQYLQSVKNLCYFNYHQDFWS